MTLQQVIQILFLVLFIGGPIFSAVAKKMQEAKVKREREIQIRKRQEEMLRTGRSADDVPAPVATSLDGRPASEAEALRRLQELARQRQAQSSQPQPGPVLPPVPGRATQPRPAQPRPVVQRPAPQRTGPQRPGQPRPGQPRPGQAGPGQRAAGQAERSGPRTPDRGRAAPSEPQTSSARDSRFDAPTTAAPDSRAEAGARASGASVGAGEPSTTGNAPLAGPALLASILARSRTDLPVPGGNAPAGGQGNARVINELRRAIVMREVLDKPLCLRD